MKVRMRSEKLVITLPVLDPPKPSRSGKRLLVATSHGFRRTAVKIRDKRIAVSVNACIRPEEPDQKKPEVSKLPTSQTRSRKR
jgi:hypothetical protein